MSKVKTNKNILKIFMKQASVKNSQNKVKIKGLSQKINHTNRRRAANINSELELCETWKK